MGDWGQIVFLLLIMPLHFFIPGMIVQSFIKKYILNKSAIDQLIISIVLSITLMYLILWPIYVFKITFPFHVVLLIFVVVFGWVFRRKVLTFLSQKTVLNVLVDYALLCVLFLGCVLLIKHFSGGNWSGDWEEHYLRTLFLKDYWPLDTLIRKVWLMPARPPLDNLLVAYFLRFTDAQFYSFQFIQTFMNSLEILGCIYLFHSILKNSQFEKWRDYSFVLLVILALNPSVIQNVTYTWTRSFTNFFILVGLTWGLKNKMKILSGCVWALGILAHYSTIVYLIPIGLIDFYLWIRKKMALIIVVKKYALLFVLLSFWVIWGFLNFGLAFFSSTSTMQELGAEGSVSLLTLIFKNSWFSFFPQLVFQWSEYLHREMTIRGLRDFFFMLYQVNFLFLMGSLGGLVVFSQLARHIRRAWGREREPLFLYLIYVAIVWILSMISVGQLYPYGLAHIELRPLTLTLLAFTVTSFPSLDLKVKIVWIVGCIIDLILGIIPHFYIQFSSQPSESIGFWSRGHASNGQLANKLTEHYVFIGDLKNAQLMGSLCLLLFVVVMIVRVYKIYIIEHTRNPKC